MKRVQIVTDSTTALTAKQIEENNIHVVPLTIYVNGESYQDGENLTPSEFLDEMAKTKELPKSSQPPVGVFQQLFDQLGENGDDVLVITMTGGMSGTVKSAEAAAQSSEANVRVIDSRFISCALGFQVLEAAKMSREGKTMDEIVQRIEEIRDHTFLYVIVDTLDNLVKGGRIGKGMGMVGSLLNIKPIANLEGGGYNPVAKVRSHKQVVKFLKKQFLEDTAGKTIKGIGIEHANGLAMGEPMLEFFKDEIGFENVHFGVTSPIISTHTGIGAIGLSYYAE